VNNLDKLFKNPELRRAVRKTQILELLAVTCCYTVTNEKGTPSELVKEGLVMSKDQIQTFYRLFFFVHQCFLSLVDLIIKRLPPESTRNIWAHSLSAILLNKSCEKLLKSKQAVDFLTESNETIIEFIKKVKLDEKKANEMRLSIKLSQGS